jgi:RHS repeat-associated protein
MSLPRSFGSLATLLFIAFSAYSAKAQDEIPSAVTDQNRSGDLPFSSVIGSATEHVLINSGNLVVNIPIIHIKGRNGLDFDFGLRYDGRNLVFVQSGGGHWTFEAHNYVPTNGIWQTNQPTLSYTTYSRKACVGLGGGGTASGSKGYILQDAQGAKHALAVGYETAECPNGSWSWRNSGPDNTDTGLWGQMAAVGPPKTTFLDASGTLFAVGNSNTINTPPGELMVAESAYINTNGNTTNNSPAGNDSLGRPIVTQTNGTNQVIYSVHASDGSTQTYTANYSTIPISTAFGYGQEFIGSRSALASVVLPNGRSYSFAYDSYGSLTSLTLPTGALITYTWANTPPNLDEYRYVASRTVTVNGVNSQWTFSQIFLNSCPVGQSNTSCTQITVTDPVNNQSVYYEESGVTIQANIYSGSASGTPLRQYSVAYMQFGDFSMLPSSVTTTLENNLVSKITYTYDSLSYTQSSCVSDSYCEQYGPLTQGWGTSRGNVQEIDVYDWGSGSPGPLLRKNVKTYLHDSNSAYIAPNIVDKVLTNTTYDGSGNQVAQTKYEYDNYVSGQNAIISTSGAPQHNSSYSSTFTLRGNVTRVSRWRNTDGAFLTSTYTYDDLGNIRAIQDPVGNTTSFDFTDRFADTSCAPPSNSQAYVGKVTNALNQNIQATRYTCTGLIQAHQDQNDINASRAGTTYTYDLLGRTTAKNFPDGGLVSKTYNDVPPVSVTTTTKMNTSQNLVSTVIEDGLGRITQAQINSDPDCTTGDKTDTTYDSLGRVSTVSNPYCIAGESTSGLTTYSYDALSRTKQVAHPDSTTLLTTYAGRATQVQDEGNGAQRVTRISQTDGLGRLASICEVASGPFIVPPGNSTASLIGSGGSPSSCGLDIAGTGFLTTYQYDALDNLLQVNQSGVNARTFAYDSLSRLLTASNPESGTINYAYDANGNLITKTAPAPNQTGTATVTTSFQYDALNRATQKSFSDGTTPTVLYFYDTPNSNYGCSGAYTNLVGRLSGSAVPGWIFCDGYDVMGRLIDKDLRTPQNQLHYYDAAYDLLGNIVTETGGYSSVTYAYNAAARLTGVTNNGQVDSQNPATPASAMHYNAFGGLTTDTLGDAEVETFNYDKRLRMQSYTATINSPNYYSTLITLYSFTVNSFAPNGDILSVNDSINGNWTYSYDPFNRLVGANQNNGAALYSYVYDRFGNRWQQNGPQTFLATFTGNNPGSPQNNNRMDIINGKYTHDAAGNVMSDGLHNYTYDAENRMINVDGGNTATYVYDADGHRVQKTSATGNVSDPAGTWIFFYDQSGRWVQKFNSPGNTFVQGHIFAAGRHLASVGGWTTFSHSDWVGTERFRTHLSGIPYQTESCSSLPFGDGLNCTGSDVDPLHFTGKERDAATGLDNFGARYNSSSFGRFMSADPLYIEAHRLPDPQRLNLYAYARNNPVNLTDPTGLDVALKCDTQANCKKAVQDFNNRKNAQFKVELGKDGTLHVVKDSVAKNLSKAEGALLGAINDTQNHATINVSGNTGQSESGVHDSPGVNSVDVENLSKFDAGSNAGGLNSGDIFAHEALDAYYSLSMGAVAADSAAAALYPGLLLPNFNVHIDRTSGVLFGQTSDSTISHGSDALGVERITIQYITPIPFANLGPNQIQGAERAAGSRTTEVVFVRPK